MMKMLMNDDDDDDEDDDDDGGDDDDGADHNDGSGDDDFVLSKVIHIYNRHADLVEQLRLPGMCSCFGWDKVRRVK